MSLTGDNLIVILSKMMGDYFASTATGGSTTTIVDTTLQQKMDKGWVGYWARPTSSGTYQYQNRRASDFVNSSGTLTVAPAFGAAIANAVTYELHRFDPADKFIALDEARLNVFPAVARTIYDDTITADGISRVFPIPSSIRSGPLMVMEECPFAAEQDWNFLSDPDDDAVTKWTGSSATVSLATRLDGDPLIPKYDESCMKIVVAASTAATVSQVVADMANGITATLSAGRTMTLARMVYSRIASKVRLQIIDDAATTSGSYHQGKGWELLTVEKDISGSNATTLTARIDITSTASALTAYANRGWFYFGTAERVRDGLYYGGIPKRVRRDDTTQQVTLDWTPGRGRQLRLIGQDTLSALGTTAASQATNTMEVDEENAQVLCAEAARILFQRRGLALPDNPYLASALAILDQKKRDAAKWAQPEPVSRRIRGMWAR